MCTRLCPVLPYRQAWLAIVAASAKHQSYWLNLYSLSSAVTRQWKRENGWSHTCLEIFHPECAPTGRISTSLVKERHGLWVGWGDPTVCLEGEALYGLTTLIAPSRPPQHLSSAGMLACMLKTPQEREAQAFQGEGSREMPHIWSVLLSYKNN